MPVRYGLSESGSWLERTTTVSAGARAIEVGAQPVSSAPRRRIVVRGGRRSIPSLARERVEQLALVETDGERLAGGEQRAADQPGLLEHDLDQLLLAHGLHVEAEGLHAGA